MKRILVLLCLLFVATSVLAFPNIDFQNKNKLNKNNEPVDKILFIHNKDGKITTIRGFSKAPKCYALEGVKWVVTPISYVIGSNNQSVIAAIATATQTWDNATSKTIYSTSYSIDPNATWDSITPDYKNSYVFGSYSNNNVIAVTSVWYMRYRRQIVDYDTLFNTYYNWKDCKAIACDTNAQSKDMDLQAIATHETGHGLGLADIYNNACSTVTMYGYASPGETQKSTLEPADITGIQLLYGK